MIIKNLDKELKTFDGMTIALTNSNKPSTFKDIYVLTCEMTRPQQSGDAIKAYSIGGKIYNSQDEVDLTNEDITFLKVILERNEMSFPSIAIAQGLNNLDAIKDESKK